MQYTLREIPEKLDQALRRRAKAQGKSLNTVAVELLAEGLGLDGSERVRRDLSDVVGTWKREKAVEAALEAQDAVDASLWK